MGGAEYEIRLLRVHSARHRNSPSLMPGLFATLTDQQAVALLTVVRRL